MFLYSCPSCNYSYGLPPLPSLHPWNRCEGCHAILALTPDDEFSIIDKHPALRFNLNDIVKSKLLPGIVIKIRGLSPSIQGDPPYTYRGIVMSDEVVSSRIGKMFCELSDNDLYLASNKSCNCDINKLLLSGCTCGGY